MREFAESVFDELDMEYFEEHGLITDRHMINQEELEKLLDASVNMSKEELDAALWAIRRLWVRKSKHPSRKKNL